MRLFVAVTFPAPLRRRLNHVALELSAEALPVRWTAVEDFHLTLRWLGERNSLERGAVEGVMSDVASRTAPFEAGFGAVGAFPSPRRPRVIWIAVEADPRLRVLRDQLERSLAAAGFPRDERSFRPHVTLGRATRGAAPGEFRPFVARSGDVVVEGVIPVRSIELMRSRTGPEGSRYERLAVARLAG